MKKKVAKANAFRQYNTRLWISNVLLPVMTSLSDKNDGSGGNFDFGEIHWMN